MQQPLLILMRSKSMEPRFTYGLNSQEKAEDNAHAQTNKIDPLQQPLLFLDRMFCFNEANINLLPKSSQEYRRQSAISNLSDAYALRQPLLFLVRMFCFNEQNSTYFLNHRKSIEGNVQTRPIRCTSVAATIALPGSYVSFIAV